MRAHPWIVVVALALFAPACSGTESANEASTLKNEHGSSRRAIDPPSDFPKFGLAPEARVIDFADLAGAKPGSADAVLALEGVEPWVDEGKAPELFSSVATALAPNGVFGVEVCGCREAKLTAAATALGFRVTQRTEDADAGSVRLVFEHVGAAA